MITKQEGGCHRQRTKDHGEKLGSGLTEVNMTSDGGVPYDMQISFSRNADLSTSCCVKCHMRVDSSRQKKRYTIHACTHATRFGRSGDGPSHVWCHVVFIISCCSGDLHTNSVRRLSIPRIFCAPSIRASNIERTAAPAFDCFCRQQQ